MCRYHKTIKPKRQNESSSFGEETEIANFSQVLKN